MLCYGHGRKRVSLCSVRIAPCDPTNFFPILPTTNEHYSIIAFKKTKWVFKGKIKINTFINKCALKKKFACAWVWSIFLWHVAEFWVYEKTVNITQKQYLKMTWLGGKKVSWISTVCWLKSWNSLLIQK